MNVRQVAFLFVLSIGLVSIGASVDAQQIQIKGPKNGTTELSGTTYGPITPEDTLWRIANRYRQNKNLSVYQVMQGIYELNPDAFEDQNFNHLKDGSILKLPSERYIARIDAEQARLKAEQDDSSWQAFSKGEAPTAQATPPSSVASKDDLTETKEVIEQKLTALDQEQNRQFMAIRQQFAESIDSVQSLLDENRKLVDRLDVVDQEIGSLRGRVDEELQVQMDQMLALQNELLSISREAEAQRKAEMESNSFAWLTDPIFLIFLTVLMSISLLGGFAMWLIRKNKAPVASSEPSHEEINAAVLEQSDEMDDLADALTNELSENLEEDSDDDLFGDDDLLDDVLSDELEESLDSSLDDEFESFDDLDDDSLDPIIEEATEELDDGDGLLDQDDLDNLFDESEDDLLADIEGELDDFDSVVTDEIGDTSGADDELDNLLDDDASDLLAQTDDAEEDDSGLDISENDLDASLDEEISASDQDDIDDLLESAVADEADVEPAPESLQAKSVIDDEPDKPEISIDELLEEPEPDLPESIISEDPDLMNEEMLQNIDKEITSQNEQLDKITDELIDEIDQLEQMGGMIEEDSEEPEDELLDDNAGDAAFSDAEQQMGIQALDSLSEDLDEEIEDSTDETLGEQSLNEIESLLEDTEQANAEPEPQETAVEVPEQSSEQLADEAVDIDDILQSVEEQASAPEASTAPAIESEPAEENNELDVDDIDALLDQENVTDKDISTVSADELLAELEGSIDEPIEEAVDASDAETTELEAATESDELLDPSDTSELEDINETDVSDAVEEDSSLEDTAASELDSEPDLEPDEEAPQKSASSTDDASLDTVDDAQALLDELQAIEEPLDTAQVEDEPELALEDEQPSEVDELADIPELDKALEEFEQDLSADDSGFDEPQIDSEEALQPAQDDVQLEQIISEESAEDIEEVMSQLDDEIPSIGDLDSISADHDDGFDDSDLDEALRSFDESSLEEGQSDTPEKSEDDVELEDLPGLGDWLSLSEAEESASIDELEKTDFDELLDSIDSDEDVAEKEAILEETGLDLDALLSESDQDDTAKTEDDKEADFLDVDDLINESIDAEVVEDADRELNLDTALDSYAGIGEIEKVDVDGDNGVGAKLDLAQAYIETENFDSAKEILDEIVDKGDDVQKAEAKELLDKLT